MQDHFDKPPSSSSSKEFSGEISSLIVRGFMLMIESQAAVAREAQAKKKDKALMICRI